MGLTLDQAIWALRSSRALVALPKPTDQWDVIINGDWPTDLSDARAATHVDIALLSGDAVLFQGQADLSIQGHFSALTENKKGLKVVWYNSSGVATDVKIGGWIPNDKHNLKGYGATPGLIMDRSMIRDVLGNRIYDVMCKARAWPDNLKCPQYVWAASQTDNSGLPAGALFGCDGFFVSLWQQTASGLTFRGVYTLRTTAPAGDFLIDKSSGADYFVQLTYGDGTTWSAYQAGFWDVTAPKKKQFDKTVLSRLIDYFNACVTGADSWDNLWKYGNVSSFVDFMIHADFIFNKDGLTNNTYFASWDKTVWYPYPYDMDETMGIYPWDTGRDVSPDVIGFCTDENPMWASMRAGLQPLIRQRWAMLRRSGVISETSVWGWVREIAATLQPETYAQDVALYGTNERASMPWVAGWLIGRLAWLDTQWGYST
ncbi:CotH kinase family protein [Gluconobacter cerinus]|uniref:CotH kinase family protein n=1 Tax=Gluconobacter cerinus TaxID=38307 RepID=UPI001B8D86CB|nr:CotH kinase family protein [Gluconobacter cerinus]MBS0995866.1 CotH kinase family protein [Gluconobacter cerinus]